MQHTNHKLASFRPPDSTVTQLIILINIFRLCARDRLWDFQLFTPNYPQRLDNTFSYQPTRTSRAWFNFFSLRSLARRWNFLTDRADYNFFMILFAYKFFLLFSAVARSLYGNSRVDFLFSAACQRLPKRKERK